jgi:hypothetical protein
MKGLSTSHPCTMRSTTTDCRESQSRRRSRQSHSRWINGMCSRSPSQPCLVHHQGDHPNHTKERGVPSTGANETMRFIFRRALRYSSHIGPYLGLDVGSTVVTWTFLGVQVRRIDFAGQFEPTLPADLTNSLDRIFDGINIGFKDIVTLIPSQYLFCFYYSL